MFGNNENVGIGFIIQDFEFRRRHVEYKYHQSGAEKKCRPVLAGNGF